MAVDYTTTNLLASIRRRGMLPSSAETLADADLLEIATEELRTYVLPMLVEVREEYALARSLVLVSNGTDVYELPQGAAGGKVRMVEASTDGLNYYPLSRIEPERATNIGAQGYEFLGSGKLLITPAPTSDLSLRVTYYRRPNRLVLPAECAQVQAVNPSTGDVTFAGTVPATFSPAVPFDVVSGEPPFDVRSENLYATSVAGTAMNLSGTLSGVLPYSLGIPDVTNAVKPGDWVCLRGESPVPQIPLDLAPLLAARVRFVALSSLGDPKAKAAEEEVERTRLQVSALLTSRSEGNSRFVLNQNAPGNTLRRNRYIR